MITLSVSKFSPQTRAGGGGRAVWGRTLSIPAVRLQRITKAGAEHWLSWPFVWLGRGFPALAGPVARTQLLGPGSQGVTLRQCCVSMAGEGFCRSF